MQQESGYPYVVNIDTANRANPVDGKIIMSNLCSEILQVQEPSLINDAQEFLQMGTDVSCNLGSTNVVNMMTSPDFGRSIRAMVRALTFVTDSSHIVAVPTINHGNSLAHTFGLGAMGLHSAIIGIIIAAVSVILAFFTVSVTGIMLGGLFIVESFSVLVEAKSAFILIFGAGLLSIGASSLVLLGISYVARFFGLLIVRLVQWILKKGKRGDRHA